MSGQRKLVGPRNPRKRRDWVYPKLHAEYWLRYPHALDGHRDRTVDDFYDQLVSPDMTADQARQTLEHVQAIAQSAVDRAAAADKRATTIAGAVAITASLTLSGSGLVLDGTGIQGSVARGAVAVLFSLAAVAFALSAVYALAALVVTRRWSWELPADLPIDPDEPLAKRLLQRAAHLREDFAKNWEISDLKNRQVKNALAGLVGGLLCLVAISVVVAAEVLTQL